MKLKARWATLAAGAVLASSVAVAALAQGMGGPMGGMGGPMGGRMSPATAQALFAKIDTSGDKQLSQDEIKAYVASQVKGLDANADGFLTSDEIAAKMTEIAQARTTDRATAIIVRMGGQDGKIAVDKLAAAPMPMDRMLQRLLAQGGGKIDKASFDQAMAWVQQMRMGGGRGMGHGMGPGMGNGPGNGPGKGPGAGMAQGGPRGGAMAPSFDELDANHDGVVTADEVQAYRLARVKAMDANGDGFVTADELGAAMLSNMAPQMATRIDAMVKRLDLNNDGKLSIEEVAAAPFEMMLVGHLPFDASGTVSEAGFVAALDGQGYGPGRGGWHHHHHGRDGGWGQGGWGQGGWVRGGAGRGGPGQGGWGPGWGMMPPADQE